MAADFMATSRQSVLEALETLRHAVARVDDAVMTDQPRAGYHPEKKNNSHPCNIIFPMSVELAHSHHLSFPALQI
jgi:hypothetical protein